MSECHSFSLLMLYEMRKDLFTKRHTSTQREGRESLCVCVVYVFMPDRRMAGFFFRFLRPCMHAKSRRMARASGKKKLAPCEATKKER